MHLIKLEELKVYKNLNVKEIRDIFIGDTAIQDKNDVSKTYNMPYLSHKKLNDLAALFGIDSIENLNENRNDKFKIIFRKIVNNNQEEELIEYLFKKSRLLENYKDQISLMGPEDINIDLDISIDCIVDEINIYLYFSNSKAIKTKGSIKIIELSESFEVKNDINQHVNHTYIHNLQERISRSMEDKDYDSVVVKCRTMIEEINIHILDYAKISHVNVKGNIGQLNALVRDYLNMKPSNDFDKRINNLLNGLNKINDSISNLRNINSDAHGIGKNRIEIKAREAKLIVNATIMYCDYILDVFEDKKKR